MIAIKLIDFRRVFKKKSSYFPPEHIRLINLVDSSKTRDLKGKMYLVHCRGHDCILPIFYFKHFYDNHIQLLSKNYFFR